MEGHPRNNKEPAVTGPGLRCIILGTVPSHRQLGEAHVMMSRDGSDRLSRQEYAWAGGGGGRQQMPAFN